MGEEWFKPDDLMLAVMAAAFVFLAMKLVPRILAGVPFARAKDLQERLDRRDDVLVLDVRNPDEYTDTLGHIPGSLNLPLSRLANRLEEIKPSLNAYADMPVFVVCRTSNRAASAARVLKKAGLKDIRVLEGGMVGWNRKGLPTSRAA